MKNYSSLFTPGVYVINRDKKNEWGFGNLDNKASKLRSKGYYKAKSKNWI